jgi:hypothetical protein
MKDFLKTLKDGWMFFVSSVTLLGIMLTAAWLLAGTVLVLRTLVEALIS